MQAKLDLIPIFLVALSSAMLRTALGPALL
jgi:hypothetical protein